MAKTRIGSNATFTGLSNSLNYVGDHVYAYNSASFNNVDTVIVEFDTGKGYVMIDIYAGVDAYDGDDMEIGIDLNGVRVMDNRSAVIGTNGLVSGLHFRIVVPPLTHCAVSMQNRTDSSAYNGYVMISGRHYA